MIEVTGRPAKLSNHVNVRAETHGDAELTAIDLPVVFAISEEELDALVGIGAYERFYVQPATGPVEPTFRGLRLALEDKIEGAKVVISIGLKPDRWELADAKLSKIMLAPAIGGMTECRLTIQALPSQEAMGAITAALNMEVGLDISQGKRAAKKPKKAADDPQLPLPTPESAESGSDSPPDHDGSPGGSSESPTSAPITSPIDQAVSELERQAARKEQLLKQAETKEGLTKAEKAELKKLLQAAA